MHTRSISILFGISLFWFSSASADVEGVPPTYSCGTTIVSQQTQIGGEWITSLGTVKALMIFIDFKDDNNNRTSQPWPVGVGPNFLNSVIDLTEGSPSGIYANVSTFFKDMSYSQFRMIGKAYYVQAPESLAWYMRVHNGEESHYSARDAIQILDQTVDFSDYDRWIDSQYSHNLGTDGILDMVFICYRDWYINRGNRGSSFYAEGWYSAFLPGGNVDVDGGVRHIRSAHAVDIVRMMQYPRFEHVVHEFGHAWGLNHQYAPGIWALMGARYPNVGSFMNSYERVQLGWMTFTDQTVSTPNPIGVADFGTSHVAYRVSLGSNQYLLLENHQMGSPYDVPDVTATSPGLWILQQAANAASPNEGNLRVVTADGRWNWSNPQWVIFPQTNASVPVLQHAAVNRTTGKSSRDMIYAINPQGQGSNNYLLAWIKDGSTTISYGSWYKGYGKDAFNLRTSLISPWSSPSACTMAGALSNNAIQFISQNGTTINLKFWIGNAQAAPPAKVQFVRLSGSVHPTINWAASAEPDLSGYKVYRNYTGTVSLIATLGTSQLSYTDPEMFIVTPGGAGGTTYWVKAYDSQGLLSDSSNNVSTYCAWAPPKVAVSEGEPESYSLAQNFPNPFNPTTRIDFALPVQSSVSLVIYDLLGHEVLTLAKGPYEAGYHSAIWDAASRASGVYLARLTVRDDLGSVRFTKVSKLVLMK